MMAGSAGGMVFVYWKRDGKTGAAGAPVLVDDRTAVLGHDAVTDGQAEAGAVRAAGEEGGEEPRLIRLGNARTAVLDVDGEMLAHVATSTHAQCGFHPRRDHQIALAAEHLDGVAEQVQEDLGQRRMRAVHGRKARIEL